MKKNIPIDWSRELPKELWSQCVSPHLSLASLKNLSTTSSPLYKLFKPDIARRLFVQHVINGDEAKVRILLDKNPELLLIKALRADDYSGRKFRNITAFQAALCTYDVEMWKMIEFYFEKIENGQEQKLKQINEIFPDSKLPIQRSYDFSQIIRAITDSSNTDVKAALEMQQSNSTLCQALGKFRTDFKNLSLKEQCFNPRHLLEALKVYMHQLTCFTDDPYYGVTDEITYYIRIYSTWNRCKCDLFWRQVIGYIQRYVPSCFAQAFTQGYISDQNQPLQRSFNYRQKKYADFYYLEHAKDFQHATNYYFPLSTTPHSGLGYDFYIGLYFDGSMPPYIHCGGPENRAPNDQAGLEEVVQTYDYFTTLQNYIARIHEAYSNLFVTTQLHHHLTSPHP